MVRAQLQEMGLHPGFAILYTVESIGTLGGSFVFSVPQFLTCRIEVKQRIFLTHKSVIHL